MQHLSRGLKPLLLAAAAGGGAALFPAQQAQAQVQVQATPPPGVSEPKEPDLWDRWAGIKGFLGSWRKGKPTDMPLPTDKLKCHLAPGGAFCCLSSCRCLPHRSSLHAALPPSPPACLPCHSHPGTAAIPLQGTAWIGTAQWCWSPAAASTPPLSCISACWSLRSNSWPRRVPAWAALR